MNRTLFKLAIRSIWSNWMNSTINSIGFSLGIAACLFLFLFLRFESSFDTQYSDQDEIFRVLVSEKDKNGVSTDGFVWFPVAPEAAENLATVRDFCRVTEEGEQKFKHNNNWNSVEKFRFVDENFFSFFGFKLLLGNPETALNRSDKIVLSESYSKQIFGNENPLGQQIVYNHKPLTVSGVATDPPTNTHLIFDALCSTKYIEESEDIYKKMGGGIMLLSYLKLPKAADLNQVSKQIDETVYKQINNSWSQFGSQLSTVLQPISDVHLSDGTIQYDCETNRSYGSLLVIAAIALLILLLSVVNYITLFTAQKLEKSRNIALMKMYGANKMTLSVQIFIEVLSLSLFSSIVGLLIFMGALPILNQLFQTSLTPVQEYVSIILFLFLITILLSSIITIIVMKMSLFRNSTTTLKDEISVGVIGKRSNNILISLQFTIVISLLISIFVIFLQNSTLLNRPLGFDKGKILCLQSDEGFSALELSGLKQKISQLSDVEAISLTSQNVGNGMTQNGYSIGEEPTLSMLNALYTDQDFLSCFGIKLIEGKNFSESTSQNRASILINKTLFKRAGVADFQSIKIGRDEPLKVIGVVNDFNFASLEQRIKPLLIMANPERDGWDFSTVNIRHKTVSGEKLRKQVATIWQNMFPDTPFTISTLEDNLAENYIAIERQKRVIALFSIIALFIAVIGLFGVALFAMKSRIKEIGIRKVNGATNSEILRHLNGDFLKWVVVAFIVATPISYFIMHRWIQNFAYQTELSWWIFALAGLFVFIIALLTVSWQSWRAATRNPVDSLRDE